MPALPVIYHPAYQEYYFGPDHPFKPARLAMLLDLFEALDETPHVHAPEPATRADILTVHDEAFVAQVEAASAGKPARDAEQYGLDTGDVPVFDGMDAAARALVGGTLHAARMVAAGEATKVLQLGGGLHHAQHALAAGFCVYNDLAVAIRHLTGQGLRVGYIDIDVHHGDGVQWIHYDEDTVLTISLHETGHYLYPGTGHLDELGKAAGRGYKLNVPLQPRTTDESYLEAFERVVPPALAWFKPDVLVIQCGADAHFRDPLADLLLTTRAYEALFHRLLDLANTHTDGRAVFTLGGGYDLDATTRVWALLYLILSGQPLPQTLPETWRTRWETERGVLLTPTLHDPYLSFDLPNRAAIDGENRLLSKRLMDMAGAYWG